MAFGYCRCLHLSVCVCVRPCVNHKLFRAITHHSFQLGSPNLDHRYKRPWLRSLLFLGVIDLDLQGPKFTPFWACPCDNSPPVRARTTKFGPEVQNTLGKIPIVLGLFELDLSNLTNFQNSVYLYRFCVFEIFVRPAKNGWNGVRMERSLFHILNGCVQICSPTALCHGPWNSRVVSLVWPLLASKGPWLGDWQWLFNASVVFR